MLVSTEMLENIINHSDLTCISLPIEIRDLCKPIPPPKNGEVKCSRSRHRTQLFYRTKCSFVCHKGYKLVGPITKQCSGTGVWDEQSPVCIRKSLSSSIFVLYITLVTVYSSYYGCFPCRPILAIVLAHKQDNKEYSFILAETCLALPKPLHGTISPLQCLTGEIAPGERCVLHCDSGFRPTSRRSAICDPQQKWMPNDNLTCTELVMTSDRQHNQLQQQFAIKPFIKCPPDATKILTPQQKTMLIKMERPKTNVDWWK